MAALALTDLLCRNAKAPDTGRVELADAKCPGLVLRVTAAGAKSWAVRYRDAGGRSQRLTIGAYPTIGLADARARAAEVRRAAVSGANPAAEKRDARENAELGPLTILPRATSASTPPDSSARARLRRTSATSASTSCPSGAGGPSRTSSAAT